MSDLFYVDPSFQDPFFLKPYNCCTLSMPHGRFSLIKATHGWCLFEHTKSHFNRHYGAIPSGKLWYRSLFHVYTKPTVLISLFDGINSSRVAFDTLPNARTNKPNEFNIIKSFVSEKDKIALAVTMRYAKDSVDLGTAENISRLTIHRKIFSDDKVNSFLRLAAWDDEVHFIIIAGPPCQDLSRAGAKDGITRGVLRGERSVLFFHVPRILRYITETFEDRKVFHYKNVHYIVENVEMTQLNHNIFCEFLDDVKPLKVDFNSGGCSASLMSRRRLYWCSFHRKGGDIGFQDFKKLRCAHPAKMHDRSLEDILWNHGLGGYEFCDPKRQMKVVSLPTLTRFAGNVGQEKYNIRKKDESDGDVIPPPMEVIEDLMGFPDPFHHTKLDNLIFCHILQLIPNQECIHGFSHTTLAFEVT